jgi:tetratricopeptide (TPR) repeat protein
MDLWTSLRRTLIPLALLLAGCATSGQTAPDAEEAAVSASTPTTAGSREDAQQRFIQGVALARQGDTEQAIAVFEALTRQYPGLPGPYNNLAVLYASRGEYDRARQVLLKTIEIQPALDTPHENLGDVYAKLAAQAYQKAFEVNSANLRAESKSELIARMIKAGSPRDEAIAADLPPALAAPAMPEPELISPRPRAPSPTGCYRVGPVTYRVDAEAIAAWARLQGLAAETRGASGEGDVAYYQVYLPPFSSREEAEQAAENLKAAGLTDLEVMYTGSLKDGISLGVYRQEASAQRRLAQLREMGVSPVLDARRKEREQYAIAISGRGTDNWRKRFAEAFPDQTLQTDPCQEDATVKR